MINDAVSVIIRTKNEERWVGHAIQSVLSNLKKPEIIIIDNNSTDETLKIIGLFIQDKMLGDKKNRNYTNIKIFNINNYTPGKALNLGVKKSTKDIILVLSAHCQLQKIDFEKHKKDLNKYDCIFGKQNPVYKGKNVMKRYIWNHFTDKRTINMYSDYEKRYFLHNALAIYKRKTLIKNKFNEALVAKEDRYWANSLINKNKKILYDPNLSALHHYTENGNTWKGLA